MSSKNNVICLDLEIGNTISPDHIYNILVVSINLDDFNERFEIDSKINYDVETYTFSPIDENDEHAVWFCEGIQELLDFSQSPTCNEKTDLDKYLENRRKEINYLHSPQLYDPYVQRYFDYAPLGFLYDESVDYIKSKMNLLLFGD